MLNSFRLFRSGVHHPAHHVHLSQLRRPAALPNACSRTSCASSPPAQPARDAPNSDTPTTVPATDQPRGPRARTTTCAAPTPDSRGATQPPKPPPQPASDADTDHAAATDPPTPPTPPNPSPHNGAATGEPSGASPRTATPPLSPQRRRATPPTPPHASAPPRSSTNIDDPPNR